MLVTVSLTVPRLNKAGLVKQLVSGNCTYIAIYSCRVQTVICLYCICWSCNRKWPNPNLVVYIGKLTFSNVNMHYAYVYLGKYTDYVSLCAKHMYACAFMCIYAAILATIIF